MEPKDKTETHRTTYAVDPKTTYLNKRLVILPENEDRKCENCGEPMKYHVGGAERGLCKNSVKTVQP